MVECSGVSQNRKCCSGSGGGERKEMETGEEGGETGRGDREEGVEGREEGREEGGETGRRVVRQG